MFKIWVDYQVQKVSNKSGHYLNSDWVWWQTKKGEKVENIQDVSLFCI